MNNSMLMKRNFKIAGLIVFTILFSINVIAQRWQLDFSAGYSFPIVAQPSFYINETSTDNSDIIEISSKKYGFSNGINSRLNLNYQFKPGFYFNLGSNFIQSFSNTEYEDNRNTTTGSTTNISTENSKWKHSLLDVQLGLTFESKLNEKFKLFLSAGPVFNLIGNSTNTYYSLEELYTNSVLTESTTIDQTRQFKSYKNFGFYSEFGISYQLNEKMQFYFSSTIRSRSNIAKSSETTSYSVNGVSQMGTLTVADKEVNFLDSYSTATANDARPTSALKSGFSNGSLGLLVGIRFSFGKVSEEILSADSLSKLYLQAGGGYGLIYNGSHLTESDVSLLGGTTNSAVPYSYGSGMNFSLLMGYRIKNNFSFELSGMYNKSVLNYSNSLSGTNPFFIFEGDDKRNNEASMIRILAGFRMERNANHLGAYIRTGISLGIGAKLIQNVDYNVETGIPGSTIVVMNETTTEFSGGLSFGLYGALGFVWNFNSVFGIFTEANLLAQNWSPKFSKLTRLTVNGADQLSSMDKADIETEYISEGEIDANAPYNPNEPSKDLIQTFPFSGAVISLGVRVNLGAK